MDRLIAYLLKREICEVCDCGCGSLDESGRCSCEGNSSNSVDDDQESENNDR